MPLSSTEAFAQYEIEFEEVPPLDRLEPIWRDLESRSPTTSFFNSWSWVGTWLAALPETFERRLLTAKIRGRIVGLGVLVRNTRRLVGVPFCTAWHLHAAGDPVYDGGMVEHNDFLIDGMHGDRLRAAMVHKWKEAVGSGQELHLPGLEGRGFGAQVSGDLRRHDEIRTSYAIDLESVRRHNLDFTLLVSGHARRFIRRSIKEYQTLGALEVHVAAELDDALSCFDRMVELHQRRWVALGETGSFKSKFRYALHRALISRYLRQGEIQILRVRAGERDVGYLYSFIRGKRIYVFQSGFDYSLLTRHSRPGLVTHTLAVQHNARLGFSVYDLMAGDSRYKSTISTLHENLTWSVWRKPAMRFVVEQQLRNALTGFRRWRASRADAAAPAGRRPWRPKTDEAPIAGDAIRRAAGRH